MICILPKLQTWGEKKKKKGKIQTIVSKLWFQEGLKTLAQITLSPCANYNLVKA